MGQDQDISEMHGASLSLLWKQMQWLVSFVPISQTCQEKASLRSKGKSQTVGMISSTALNWESPLVTQPLGEQDLRSFRSFPSQAKQQILRLLSCERLRPRCLLVRGETWGVSPSSALHLLPWLPCLKDGPATAPQEALLKSQLSAHDQFCYGRKGAPLSQYLHLAKPYPQAEWALLIYLFIFPEMNTECLLWEAKRQKIS